MQAESGTVRGRTARPAGVQQAGATRHRDSVPACIEVSLQLTHTQYITHMWYTYVVYLYLQCTGELCSVQIECRHANNAHMV